MEDTIVERVPESGSIRFQEIATEEFIDNKNEPDLGLEVTFEQDKSSELIQGEENEESKATEGYAEQSKDDDLEEHSLSEEAIQRLELEKKKKRREEKRQKDEAMRKHFIQPDPEQKFQLEHRTERLLEPETESESESETEPKRRTTLDSTHSMISDDLAEAIDQKNSMLLSSTYDIEVIEEIGGQLSSSSDEEDYARQTRLGSFKDDFFQNIYFPSLSDISSDSSIEEDLRTLRSTIMQQREAPSVRDEGTFVDPLTGEPIPDQVEQPTPESKETSEEEEEKSSKSEISFDWPFELDDIEAPVAPKKLDFADEEMTFELNARSSHRLVSAISTTQMESRRSSLENRQIVIEFVFKLIDDAVATAEYVDPLLMMSLKMDKLKLINDLHRLMNDFNFAHQYNTFLSSKMYEYYRRIGQMRGFKRLPPDVSEVEFKRHREALQNLDHLKKKAAETKRLHNLVMASVSMDLAYARNITFSTVESLEKCFHNTLLRKDMTFLPRIVDLELRRMQNLRNEISDSRLWLITRQHTLGRLIERKRKFDQITEELTMDQFLNAQREVASLDTKVEEREHDLKRMHDRCSKHVHQLAFIREKTSMLSESFKERKQEMAEKQKRQSQLRDQVLKLKMQRSRLKEQKMELQEKSGLLYKPALLIDYDDTVEIIKTKKKSVKKLKNTIHDLEARIAMFEHMCANSVTSIPTPNKNLRSSKVT